MTKCGIPPYKIHGVVPVGVNISIFQPIDGSHFRKKLGIEHDVPLILTVSRLHPHKGLQYLIKAMDYVVQEEPKVFLIIKGSGPLRNELENLIEKLKLERNLCLLTSHIPRNELVLLYASCDLEPLQ